MTIDELYIKLSELRIQGKGDMIIGVSNDGDGMWQRANEAGVCIHNLDYDQDDEDGYPETTFFGISNDEKID